MAAIFLSRIPISPEYQGEAVPSIIWPLVMTRSKGWGGVVGHSKEQLRTMKIANQVWCSMGRVTIFSVMVSSNQITLERKQWGQAFAAVAG
jgi:hypothetical protein